MLENEQDVQKPPEPEFPGLDIAFEEAKRQIDFQFSQIDGLDAKSSVMIGLAGALLSLTFTVVPTLGLRIDNVSMGLILLEIVYSSISLISAAIAIFPQQFKNAPSIQSLTSYYLLMAEKSAKHDLLEEFEKVIIHNQRRMALKINLAPLSQISLLISIILFISIPIYRVIQIAF